MGSIKIVAPLDETSCVSPRRFGLVFAFDRHDVPVRAHGDDGIPEDFLIVGDVMILFSTSL
jgi:hypothetical protein